ncbi:DUF1761 domain-containing protein [Gammaproteobacteria bacterium AH-315-E17]|nr:DUF1761 domain-containing protein [Gammaproteobacteria bacterium AH-315-E17]
MELVDLNFVGILAATVIGMVLGSLWYSPLLFGKQWMTAIGKTPETLGSPTGPIIGSIVASLMTAIGVSIIFSLITVDSLTLGITVGLTLGVLIIFPAMLSDSLFCGWGNRLLIIQSGYRAVSILLMSVALVYLN